jgi:hypothetical protein
MRIYLALAALAAMLVGGIAFEAHAYTCTTSCFGNTCTTTCF